MMSKKVFIACPIGADNSPERARSDKQLKFVIHPVIKQLLGVAPEEVTYRADKMGEPGRITTQILRELVAADVVIGDLTETNPNVMYEVGIRQAVLKPLVLMCEKGQRLPFDLTDQRTVFYQLDLEHFESVQTELKSHMEMAFAGTVAPLDKLLFAAQAEGQSEGGQANSRDLLAVLDVCQGILKEAQETKELVNRVGVVALEIRGSKEEQERQRQDVTNQQMGMLLMQQFFQNPDAVEKLLPAIQKMAEFGNAQRRAEEGSKNG